MDAILAVAIGGNALGGGKLSITGSIIGAYTIEVLNRTLLRLEVNTETIKAFKAVFIIILMVVASPVVKDFASKDPEKVLAHYADDADSMIPEMKLMTGHDSIRAGLKEEFSDPNSTLDFRPAKVVVAKSGEFAYSQGTYDYTSTDPKTKKTVKEHGNYVEVYKKQADGSWKAAEDIATQEAPPASIAPASK
jgi:ketosteroid isomerase-like protein